jgi:hypothetical protein
MKDDRKKITFIYAHEGEEWSTPMALAKEFRSRGGYVNFVSIGSNGLRNWNDSQLKEWIESQPKTNIVLFMDWGRFDSPLLNKELVKELYQLERQYDAPVKVINIKDIISNYNLPNQDELVERYDDLVRREDEKTAEIITQLTSQAAQYQVPPEMLQQAILEILAGEETPTVDQILQMIEEQVAQQEQMAAQQPAPGQPGMEQMGQMDQMGQMAGMMGAPTGDLGDEVLSLAQESEELPPEEGVPADLGDEVLSLAQE